MLDLPSESLVALAKPMIPSWASALAPCIIDSRMIALAAGARAGLDLARSDGLGMATAVVQHATRLSAEEFRSSVAEVIALVLDGLSECGFPHPVRMWNFVPGIHACMGDGLDRYRVFNLGRFDAFSRCFGGARPEAFAQRLPAASAVGHQGEHLVVCALGSLTPGVPVENPRQTPSFGYSQVYGPKPPCFARATVARMPAGTRLLVSGTASIRGEDSVHEGSLNAQLEETFKNLDGLFRNVRGEERFELSGIENARVYFPRAVDCGPLATGVLARFPATASVEFFPAAVCRAELLVEIEATLAPSPRD